MKLYYLRRWIPRYKVYEYLVLQDGQLVELPDCLDTTYTYYQAEKVDPNHDYERVEA